LTTLAGRLVVRRVAAATRSARVAAVLVTDDGQERVLRRRGAPGLDLDPTLAALDGLRVRVDGDVLPETVLVDSVTVEPAG
jgi:hypothetical protein